MTNQQIRRRNFGHVSGGSKGHLILFKKASLDILDKKVEETRREMLKADNGISIARRATVKQTGIRIDEK